MDRFVISTTNSLVSLSFSLSGIKRSIKGKKSEVYDLSSGSRAQDCKEAWLYRACHYSNLNGLYLRRPHSTYAVGGDLGDSFRGHLPHSLKRTEMKVKPNI